MRLSYYIHLGYGKKLTSHMGSNHGHSVCEPSILPLDQSANIIKSRKIVLQKYYHFLVLFNVIKKRKIVK